MSYSKEDFDKALKTLQEGGIILYPTDTVWGIGCDATNEEAIKKIYDIKKRNDSKSMLVLVDSKVSLERTVDQIPEVAWQLIEAEKDPLTVIYDHPINVAEILKSADGSLGVRITREKFSQELCKRLRKPLVSTSANISGQDTPKNFKQISNEIIDKMDYVVNYRQDDTLQSTPSHIIKLSSNGVFKIIR